MRTSWFALLLILSASAVQSFAACHAVGPTATGNGSGSDWNNRMNKLSSQLVRGDTYYIMDGSYGSYTFNTAPSGATLITIKKAAAADNGSSCSPSIAAGWNASTMGSSQARFSSVNLTNSYLTLDGNGSSTGPGCGISPGTKAAASDCGIYVGPGSSGNTWPVYLSASGQTFTNVTIRYVEVQGGGTASSNSGNEEDDFMCWGHCNNYIVDHIYTYDSGCVFFKIQSASQFTVRNSYVRKNNDNSSCHGQMWLQQGATSAVDFHNNVIQDITGTGVFVAVTGGTMTDWNVYNNVIWHSGGTSAFGLSNGIMAAVNSGSRATNFKFIGNTVVSVLGGFTAGWNFENSGSSLTVQNNLYYNSDSVNGSGGFTLTEDHNSCLNTHCSFSSSTDVEVASGAANPFVNWPNADFRLASQDSNWVGGVTLVSPYNIDALGNLRPGTDGVWDRGALEFAGTQAQAPAPPTNLTGTVL